MGVFLLTLLIFRALMLHPVRLGEPALDLQLRQEAHHVGMQGDAVSFLERGDNVDEIRAITRVSEMVALREKSREEAVIFFKVIRVSVEVSEVGRRTDGEIYAMWPTQTSLAVMSSVGWIATIL
jgi:hypothetical protein